MRSCGFKHKFSSRTRRKKRWNSLTKKGEEKSSSLLNLNFFSVSTIRPYKFELICSVFLFSFVLSNYFLLKHSHTALVVGNWVLIQDFHFHPHSYKSIRFRLSLFFMPSPYKRNPPHYNTNFSSFKKLYKEREIMDIVLCC